MAQTYQANLLEVVVTQRTKNCWEWHVTAGDEVFIFGLEKTQLAARYAGNDAMFQIMASGWNLL